MTITTELSDIRKVYDNADKAGKITLEKLFSKAVLGADITERVKTFEDVCAEMGTTPKSVNRLFPPTSVDYERLRLICEVLNEGWVPDWSNPNQKKYYPWFDFRGGRFVFYCVTYYYSISYLGSRLCYRDERTARYAGTQFEGLYNNFLTL